MFWNDPNLYSVAFEDLPNTPRFFNPYPVPPQIFTPPMTPYMHTPPVTPFDYRLPYFQGYRPFGL